MSRSTASLVAALRRARDSSCGAALWRARACYATSTPAAPASSDGHARALESAAARGQTPLGRSALALAAASLALAAAAAHLDALPRPAREAADAAAAAAALARTVWSEAASAASSAGDAGAGCCVRRVPAAVARLLAELAGDAARRDALASAGDGAVLDWLLRCAGGSEDAAAAHAREALAALLRGGRGAESVMARRGVGPALLRASAADDAPAAALRTAALAATAVVPLRAEPPEYADVTAAVDAALGPRASVVPLGVALLSRWACGSAGGAEAVAGCGGGDAFAAALSPSSPPPSRAAAARGIEALLRRGAQRTLPRGTPAALAAAAAEALTATPRDAELAAAATRALTAAAEAAAASGSRAAAGAAMGALSPLIEPLVTAQAGPSADDAPRSAELALATAAACAAVAGAGALSRGARAAAAPPLLRWSGADAVDAAAELAAAAPAEGDDPAQAAPPAVPPLRTAAQAALRAMVAPPPPGGSPAELAAGASTAHAWLAALLRSLAAGSAGWAPRVVADDASAAAAAAAAALDAAAAVAAPPPPPAVTGAEPRRLYGLLPPAAPPPPPAPPADAAAAAAADGAAETALRLGLKALAVLLAAEPSLAPAALQSGALDLLARFTSPAPLRANNNNSGEGAAAAQVPEGVRRQVARCAAALSLLPAASAPLRQPPWADWLAAAARSAQDAPPPTSSGVRKLASHARRAQLNADANAPGAHRTAPRFADGLFFFVPSARNLAPPPGSPSCGSEAAAAADVAPCEPGCDVVFVHGLRGGPYGTWRVGLCPDDADTASPPRRRAPAPVWPADWLAVDEPRARVLSLGFRTRYSDWEGATHGLEALADAMLTRLTAAGCGDNGRPLLLVGHSMGGVLIKLMMARAQEAEAGAAGAAARTLRGAVFFSCPHFGSRLAELGSWRVLRLAPGVAELRPANVARLEELNETLRRAHKRAGVRVLSFLEGAPTRLLRVPVFRGRHITAEVVAMESAYPGFGEMVVLPESDHIDACKPRSREEPGYARVLAMVREVLAEAEASRQNEKQTQTSQPGGSG